MSKQRGGGKDPGDGGIPVDSATPAPDHVLNQILSSDVNFLKDRVNQLERLLAEKEESLAETRLEYTDRAEFLTKELKSYEQNLFKREQELETIHELYAKKLKDTSTKYEQDLADLRIESAQRIASINEVLDTTRARLMLADSTLELRSQLEQEIQRLKDELAKEREASLMTVSESDRKLIQVKADFENNQRQVYKKLQEQARREALAVLSFEQRHALQVHNQTVEELDVALKETLIASEDREGLASKLRSAQLALQVQNDAQKHWAIRCNRLVRANRLLKERVESVERAKVASEEKLARVEETCASQIKTLEKTAAELQKKIDSLERTLHLKTQEAKHLRYVHDKVLSERSEVQQFFIDALADIKRDVMLSRQKTPLLSPNSHHRNNAVSPKPTLSTLVSTFSTPKGGAATSSMSVRSKSTRSRSTRSFESAGGSNSHASASSTSTAVSSNRSRAAEGLPPIASPTLKSAGSFFVLSPKHKSMRDRSMSSEASQEGVSPVPSRKSPHLRTVRQLRRVKNDASGSSSSAFALHVEDDPDNQSGTTTSLVLDPLYFRPATEEMDFDPSPYIHVEDTTVSCSGFSDGLDIASGLVENHVKLEDLTTMDREKVLKFFLNRLRSSTSKLFSRGLQSHADRQMRREIHNISALFTPRSTSTRDPAEAQVGFQPNV